MKLVYLFGWMLQAATTDDSSYALREAWKPYITIATPDAPSAPASERLSARLGYNEEHTQRVLSPVAGRVVRVHVTLGQKVKRGEKLIDIVSPDIASLRGELAAADEDLTTAEHNLQRAERLLVDGALAEREAALARSEAHKARSAQSRLIGHFEAWGVAPRTVGAQGTLLAQVDGVITQRHVQVGQLLRGEAEEPLLTLSQLDTLWVEADLFVGMAEAIPEGSAVDVVVLAVDNKPHPATLLHVDAVVDKTTRAQKVRLVLANPERKFKPEMVAQLLWPDASAGVWVPSRAVVSNQDKSFVWVVHNQDRIERHFVTTGTQQAGRTYIRKGLTAQERIITRGALLIQQAVED